MEFNNHRAIYLQIAEMICERILLGQFREDERIPSVREMAVQLEVNPNTVMRTFEFLQAKDIITNKRGVGYFVSVEGKQKATSFRTAGHTLPLQKTMCWLAVFPQVMIGCWLANRMKCWFLKNFNRKS